MSSELESILSVGQSAAALGGEVLCRFWRDGVESRDKSAAGGKSYDLVSDADLESQSVIVSAIADAFPEHEILGEEDLVGDVEAEHLWVVDPLDGTNNFLHRVPHFAVSIAYIRSGVPHAGVILNPITGEQFTAILGAGSKQNQSPIAASTASQLNRSLVGCGFYYDRGDMMRCTLSALEDFFSHEIHGVRRFGTAALDLCAVANGSFGVFFEYKLSPWDFAAGQLIVTEAGGVISDARGEALGLTQTSVLAAGPHLHSQALEITRRHHPA